MKRFSTLFLKIAVILIGIPVLAFCIFAVPGIAKYAVELFPDFSLIRYLVPIFFYLTAIPFYLALYKAFKLLSYIDRNEAFSGLSVKALKDIKLCAAALGILYMAGMPLFYFFGDRDDAPGVILLGMVIIFASIVVAVFTGVLQNLLKSAIDIKSENDLTI